MDDSDWSIEAERIQSHHGIPQTPGHRTRPPPMATLPTISPHMLYGAPIRYRGNCRRSNVQNRSRRTPSQRSERSESSADDTPSTPTASRLSPIAGDVFAMYPELFASPRHSQQSEATTVSPLGYLTKRRVRTDSSVSSTSSFSLSSPSRSVIFIDCPTK